jgi:hypothetical protein
MNKSILISFVFLFLLSKLSAQLDGSFTVGGDVNSFYPVSFYDVGYDNNVATELAIGRSSVHVDAEWRGSLIAKFKYHLTFWGNGSQFIDADIKSFTGNYAPFIAGWQDVSGSSSDKFIIIWLRGGGTTYFFHCNYALPQPPAVFLGGYQQTNGPFYNSKTTPDDYVNNKGISNSFTANFNGDGTNYFGGNIAIGTRDPKGYRLAVNGSAGFNKVVVKPTGYWPDYVFHANYRLQPLNELEQYIQQHQHLPEVPSAEEAEKDGIDVGGNQAILLKKIEELTLYVIEQQKSQQKLDQRVNALEQENEQLKKQLNIKK